MSGKTKPLQYFYLENPKNSMKRQNDRILKEELLRSVGAQYATGDQWTPRGPPRVPAPLPLSPFSPPDRVEDKMVGWHH